MYKFLGLYIYSWWLLHKSNLVKTSLKTSATNEQVAEMYCKQVYCNAKSTETHKEHFLIFSFKHFCCVLLNIKSFLLFPFQPQENFNEWRLLYFISFLLLVGFFVLNMFVGVVVENFHKCRENQEKEERAARAAKRSQKMEQKRKSEDCNTTCGWYH